MTPEAKLAAQQRLQAASPKPQRRRLGSGSWGARTGTWSTPTFVDGVAKVEVGRRNAMYRRCLGVSDLLSAAVALVLALTIFGDDALRPATLVALPLVVLVAKFTGLYDRDELVLNKTTLDEAPALFNLATLYTLLIFLGEDVLVNGHLGQTQIVGLWAVLFLTSIGGRALARKFARIQTPIERCLVIGAAEASRQLANKLHRRQELKAAVIGRVPLDPEDYEGSILGPLDDLARVIEAHRIDRVIVAPQGTDSEVMLATIQRVKSLGVQVSLLPRLLEVLGSSIEYDNVYGMSVLGLRRFGLTRSSALVKRALDLVGAAFAIVILSPLLIAITISIRLSSSGPVVFRQPRVGRDGELFEMLKFRSMYVGSEDHRDELREHNEAAEGLFKIADDPRVTPVGRFLRRSSLDELPQLYNVLKGEMSLVGPRPLVEDEDRQIEGRHRRRLHLKPGMTGHWQIFGSSSIPLREMVTIDYLYVANWSLWNDVKVLLRTVPYVLARRGL
jgi:exopolysaccharide biosynthesis polyprenyl glycosylphosphotransferase